MAYAGDYTKDHGNYNVGARYMDKLVTLVRSFDCSEHNLTAASYYKLFAVPANFQVFEAYVAVTTSETSASSDTLDIVTDDATTNTLVSSVAMLAGTVGATNARVMFTSAGYISAKPDTTLTTAVFTVTIVGMIAETAR
jgi:hypothetical protein